MTKSSLLWSHRIFQPATDSNKLGVNVSHVYSTVLVYHYAGNVAGAAVYPKGGFCKISSIVISGM